MAGPLTRLRQWWRARNDASTSRDQLAYAGVVRRSLAVSGISVDENSALTLAAVWCAVRALSEPIAAMPYHVYQRTGTKTRTLRSDHPVDWLLSMQPNPEQTAFDFWDAQIQRLLTWGNSYAEIERNARGEPAWLWPIEPWRVSIQRNAAGGLEYHVVNSTRNVTVLDPANVYHLHGLGDGLQGWSVIGMARESIALGLTMEQFGSAFFGNGAQAGAVITAPEGVNLSKPAVDAMLEEFKSRHGGAQKAFAALFLDKGMKVDYPSVPPEDAQFLQSRKFNVVEISRWFRVPPHLLYELDRATFCLPAGSQVMTCAGPRPIEQIEPGTEVWSLDAEGRWVKKPVTHSVCSGEDEILRIRTTNRTLRLNAKHPVLVRRKFSAPRSGQGGYQGVEWRNQFVPAGELAPGDTIVCMDRLPDEGNAQAPTRQASLGFMEFCGLLLGDGNVYPKWGVTIARASSAAYMDHYRGVMRAEFRKFSNYNGREQAVAAIAPINLQEHERQTRFASVSAARELTQLGLSGDARTKRVPAWVFGMTRSHRLAFLRGFLDADGSVDKMGRISFSSCNEEMLGQIRHLCISVGVPVTNLRNQRGTTTLPNRKRMAFSQFNFTCSDPGANAEIGSNDPRYTGRFRSGKPFNRKARNYPRYGGLGFDMPGCSLARVARIEREPSEPVYDLEVADTHNFVAEGVVVHNSNIEHQSLEYVMHSLLPWVRRIEKQTDVKLFGRQQRGVFYSKLNMDGMLRGDIKSRFEAYSTAHQNAIYSANDIRELEDMNPVPGGDLYVMQSNMIPADQLRELTDANIKKTKQPPAPPQPGGSGTADEPEDEPKDDGPRPANARVLELVRRYAEARR